jgi:hypothetical protein
LFDLRAALSEEVRAAISDFDSGDGRPKAVHRCRVRLKRARALARVGRSGAPGLSAVFEDSAQALMACLSHERDLTALSETALDLSNRSSKRAAAALDSIANVIDAERGLVKKIDPETVRTALKDLLALAQVWPEPSERQITRGAKHIIRRARKSFKRSVGAADPVLRHDWRKREKARFYASILLHGSFPAKRRRKRGERLGNVLGQERDILLLLERVSANPAIAGSPSGAVAATQALVREGARLSRRADKLGARLHAGGA